MIKKDNSLPSWYQKLLGNEIFQQYKTVVVPRRPSFKLQDIVDEITDLNFVKNLIVYDNDFEQNELEQFSEEFNNINIEIRSSAKFQFSVYDDGSVTFE